MIYVVALAAIVAAVYGLRRLSARRKEAELQRLKRSIAVAKRVSGEHWK
jgi:hypothetical protein